MAARVERDERGAVAVLTAIVVVVLLVVSAFAVDIGNTWARRGQLQVQADKAALYAAEFLPVAAAGDELDVAAAAAWYIACHPVPGQRETTSAMPDCAGPADRSPADEAIRQFGQWLLDEGLVGFTDPTMDDDVSQTVISVETPPARVDYGFGALAGRSGAEPSQGASAKVSSPGDLLPIGLSLECLSSFLGSAAVGHGDTLTGILPFGYVATGKAGPGGGGAGSAGNGGAGNGGKGGNGGGNGGGTPASTTSPVDLDEFIGCSTTLSSPRQASGEPELTANIRGGLDHALVAHPGLAQISQGLASVGDGGLTAAELSGILSSEGYLFECKDSDPLDVIDKQGRVNQGEVPNCVQTNLNNFNERDDFTAGFLGAQGRLSCEVSACADGYTVNDLPGVPGTYNADTFDRFIVDGRGGSLTDQLFYALSTYLLPDLPLVTPTDAIDEEIFESPRFFWAPIITTSPFTTGMKDYPVLTFRPVFLTPGRPVEGPAVQTVDQLAAWLADRGSDSETVASLLEEVGGLGGLMNLDDAIDRLLGALGNDAVEEVGLVLDPDDDGRELKAARFMTIETGALPSVPLDFGGPTTEYLGTGPKVVRLVE
jgi:hypothetical protein